jgi:hypothetical protein
MILSEFSYFATSVAIKHSKKTISITNVQFRDVRVFHTASPPLHLGAAESNSVIFAFVIRFLFIR